MPLSLLIGLSLVVYRVTRFALEDSMIDRQRIWLQARILGVRTKDERVLKEAFQESKGLRAKLYILTGCHFCAGIWVAAGAVALTDWRTSVPLPVWMWLAAAGGSAVVWRVVEE